MLIGVTYAADLVNDPQSTTMNGYNVRVKSAIETGRRTGYAESIADRSVFSRSVNTTFYYLDTHNDVLGSTSKNANMSIGSMIDCRVSYTTLYSYVLIYKVSSSHNITDPVLSMSWTPHTECTY